MFIQEKLKTDFLNQIESLKNQSDDPKIQWLETKALKIFNQQVDRSDLPKLARDIEKLGPSEQQQAISDIYANVLIDNIDDKELKEFCTKHGIKGKALENVMELAPSLKGLNLAQLAETLKDPEITTKILAYENPELTPIALILLSHIPDPHDGTLFTSRNFKVVMKKLSEKIHDSAQKAVLNKIATISTTEEQVLHFVRTANQFSSVNPDEKWELLQSLLKKVVDTEESIAYQLSSMKWLTDSQFLELLPRLTSEGNTNNWGALAGSLQHLDLSPATKKYFFQQALDKASPKLVENIEYFNDCIDENDRNQLRERIMNSENAAIIFPKLDQFQMGEKEQSELLAAILKNRKRDPRELLNNLQYLTAISQDELYDAFTHIIRRAEFPARMLLVAAKPLDMLDPKRHMDLAKVYLTRGYTDVLFQQFHKLTGIPPEKHTEIVEMVIERTPSFSETIMMSIEHLTGLDSDTRFKLAKLYAQHTKNQLNLEATLKDKIPQLNEQQWTEIREIILNRNDATGMACIIQNIGNYSGNDPKKCAALCWKVLKNPSLYSCGGLVRNLMAPGMEELSKTFFDELLKELPYIMKPISAKMKSEDLLYVFKFYRKCQKMSYSKEEISLREFLLEDLLKLHSPDLKNLVFENIFEKNITLPTKEINTKPIAAYIKTTETYKDLTKEQKDKLNKLSNEKSPTKRKKILEKADDLPDNLVNEIEQRHKKATLKKYIRICVENYLEDPPTSLLDIASNSRLYRDGQMQVKYLRLIEALGDSTHENKNDVINNALTPWLKKIQKESREFNRYLRKIITLFKLEKEEELSNTLTQNEDSKTATKNVEALFTEIFIHEFKVDATENFATQYEKTFGNKQIFRDESTIEYLATLKSANERRGGFSTPLRALQLFVNHVLSGDWLQFRKDSDNAPVYDSITESHPGFTKSWSQEKIFKASEVISQEEAKYKEIAPKEFLKEKIIDFKHFSKTDDIPKVIAWLKDESDLPTTSSSMIEQLLINYVNAPNDFTRISVLEQIEVWQETKAQDEFLNDIQTLIRKMKAKGKEQPIEGCTIEFTKSPFDFLAQGTEIQGSCQRVDGSAEFNQGLATRLISEDSGLMVVKSPDGKMVGRALLRLMKDEAGNPCVFVERYYSNPGYSWSEDALTKTISKMAKEWKIPVLTKTPGKHFEGDIHYPGNGHPDYVDANQLGIQVGKYLIRPPLYYFSGSTPVSDQG